MENWKNKAKDEKNLSTPARITLTPYVRLLEGETDYKETIDKDLEAIRYKICNDVFHNIQ